MIANIKELQGKEAGLDIYVLGSGKSMDYLPANFFQHKVCIGVNFVPKDYPCKYAITHHTQPVKAILQTKAIPVFPEYEMCMQAHPKMENLCPDYFWYKHREQTFTEISLDNFDDPESLTAGGTIITTAIHLAYRLGAANIILAGVDGGRLDGCMNYEAYNPGRETGIDHPTNVQAQLQKIVDHVRSLGVGVMSINPFSNFRMEGHVFEYFDYEIGKSMADGSWKQV